VPNDVEISPPAPVDFCGGCETAEISLDELRISPARDPIFLP